MRVYHRRGRLIGESQERVARAIRLRRMPGDVGVSPTTKAPFSWPEAVSQVQRATISAIPTFVFGRFHQ